MATATATIPASDTAVASPALEVLRDISRGGFAGILIGLVGCGIGGRLVMRLAALWLYGGVALIGTVLVLPLTLAVFLLSHTSSLVALGIALVITGLATLAWWIHRQRGPAEPTAKEVMVGRGGLLVLTVIGLITFVPELAGALGA